MGVEKSTKEIDKKLNRLLITGTDLLIEELAATYGDRIFRKGDFKTMLQAIGGDRNSKYPLTQIIYSFSEPKKVGEYVLAKPLWDIFLRPDGIDSEVIDYFLVWSKSRKNGHIHTTFLNSLKNFSNTQMSKVSSKLSSDTKIQAVSLILEYLSFKILDDKRLTTRAWCQFFFAKKIHRARCSIKGTPDIELSSFFTTLSEILSGEFVSRSARFATIDPAKMNKLYTVTFKGYKGQELTATSVYKAMNIYSDTFSMNYKIRDLFKSVITNKLLWTKIKNFVEHHFSEGKVKEDVDLHTYISKVMESSTFPEIKEILTLVSVFILDNLDTLKDCLRQSVFLGMIGANIRNKEFIDKVNKTLRLLKMGDGTTCNRYIRESTEGNGAEGATFMLMWEDYPAIVERIQMRRLFWEGK